MPLVVLPPPARVRQRGEHGGRVPVERHQIVLTPEQVQLPGHYRVGGLFGGVDHDEVVARVGVAPGALVRPGHVLQRHLVEAEGALEQGDLGGTGIADVEPEPVGSISEEVVEPVGGASTGDAWAGVSTTSRRVAIGPPRMSSAAVRHKSFPGR